MDEGLIKSEARKACGLQRLVQAKRIMTSKGNIDRKTQMLRPRRAADPRIVQPAPMGRQNVKRATNLISRLLQSLHKIRPMIDLPAMTAPHFGGGKVWPSPIKALRGFNFKFAALIVPPITATRHAGRQGPKTQSSRSPCGARISARPSERIPERPRGWRSHRERRLNGRTRCHDPFLTHKSCPGTRLYGARKKPAISAGFVDFFK